MNRMEIKDILLHAKLFESLSNKEIEKLSNLCRINDFAAGVLLVKEGDIGDQLYILISGEVRVFTYDQDGNEIVLAHLEKGHCFGEQAILTAEPILRNASVLALTDVKTIIITHEAFQKCLESNEWLRSILSEQGQAQQKLISYFHDQASIQKNIISLFNQVEHLKKGHVIFQQGDKPDYAYYLISGSVEVSFETEEKKRSVSLVRPGQYFGEFSIIKDNLRSGTARTATDCDVAKIDAKILKDFYEKDPDVKTLLNSFIRVYEIPFCGFNDTNLRHLSWKTGNQFHHSKGKWRGSDRIHDFKG